MKNRMLYILFAYAAYLFNAIDVINIPTQSNIVESLVPYINLMGLGRGEKVRNVTSAEAEHYLGEAIKQQYGDDLSQFFFLNGYFDDPHPDQIDNEKSANDIFFDDPYAPIHTFNMTYVDLDPEGRMKKEDSKRWTENLKRWNPDTLLLSPQEALNAFKEYVAQHYSHMSGRLEEKQDLLREMFSHVGVPEDSQARKDFFLHKPFGFLTQALVASTYKTAQRILAATAQGDYIVIFGNTPYFVGRALQKLISKEPGDLNYRVVIEFPFSGSPNRQRENNLSSYANYVTKERLEHLHARMKKVGLDPSNNALKKLYLVDVIASGSGPAYFIEELIRMYRLAGKPLPDMNIIALNIIKIGDLNSPRQDKITLQSADDGQTTQLVFPSKNSPHFSIDAQVILLEGHHLYDMLPSDDYRMFPEYNASFWRPEFDYLLTQPLTKIQRLLVEFFDTNVDHLMDIERETH